MPVVILVNFESVFVLLSPVLNGKVCCAVFMCLNKDRIPYFGHKGMDPAMAVDNNIAAAAHMDMSAAADLDTGVSD